MATSKPSKPTAGWGIGIPAAAAAVTFSSFNANIDAEMTKPPPPVQASAPTAGAHAIDERLLNSKLEAVEARTETKFAQLMGKIELLLDSVGGIKEDVRDLGEAVKNVDDKTTSTRIIIVTTAIASVIGIVGLLYAIIGYGNMVADSVTSGYSAGIAASQTQTSSPNTPAN